MSLIYAFHRVMRAILINGLAINLPPHYVVRL